MRIGINIDGVLTDVGKFSLDYFSKFCVLNGIDYKIGESDYDEATTFGIDKTYGDMFWGQHLDFYAKHEPARPFASEVIKKLKNDGNEIYIVTARWLSNREDKVGANMRKTVKKWLSKNKICYDKLVFCKAKNERKIDEILGYNIDVMIEDNPANIMELSKFVKIICYDTSYNKKCNGGGVIRCFSWYDIYKNISMMKGEQK